MLLLECKLQSVKVTLIKIVGVGRKSLHTSILIDITIVSKTKICSGDRIVDSNCVTILNCSTNDFSICKYPEDFSTA